LKKEPIVMILEVIMPVVTVNILGVLTHVVKCLLFAVYGPQWMQIHAVKCLLCSVCRAEWTSSFDWGWWLKVEGEEWIGTVLFSGLVLCCLVDWYRVV